MATTITATDVIASYGSYYINSGQNLTNLRMRPFEPFGTRDAFTNVPSEDTQLRFSDTQVSEILQPYQDTFTAKGSVTFEPVTINLQPVKVDQQFNPSSLVYSWLGFLTNQNTDRTTWPFVKWLMEVYLLQQLFQDLELKVIYSGVKAAVVNGTAGAAADVMDGIKKQINAAITAGKITPIATGALSTDPVTFCTQVETFVASIPELYWEKNMVVNLSRTLQKRYRAGKRAKYNMYYGQESDLDSIADQPNIKVKGRASHKGAAKIWATPIENAIFAVKGFENANGFELEKIDRNVKCYTDFHIGSGFLLNDLVFTNDQDLV